MGDAVRAGAQPAAADQEGLMIPNATADQLASQERLQRRVDELWAKHAARKLDRALARRPELRDIAAAGVVLREAVGWSA